MRQPYLLAVLSGLLLALSWPTYGFSLLVFVGFVPLLFAEHLIRTSEVKKKGRKVFFTAYLSFFVWNIITTWWIYYSTAFGMLFAVLVNSLLMTLVFWLYHQVAKRTPSKIYLLFLPAIWMAFEKFHLYWAFSWPWLNLGNVFASSTSYIQWYEYTGSFGGSLWVWLLNIGVYTLLLKYLQHKTFKSVQKGVVYMVLLIIVPIGISLVIKSGYEEKGKELNALILQPNINPYTEKYNMSNVQVADLLVGLSERAIGDSTQVILAPETVLADNIRIDMFSQSLAVYKLRDFLAAHPKVDFLGGVSFVEVIKDKSKVGPQTNRYDATTWYNEFNSAFFLNGNSDSIPLYHKSKLVVGVETFPYKSVLEPIFGDIMLDIGGTVSIRTTQEERTVFKDGYKIAPIVCYESVYGEFVTGYVANGAECLGIITNDAWWENTQGHKQHLNYARLRAIETRRSVLRSANTGVSAIINQTGEIEQTLAYNEQGTLNGKIHLNDKITFYVRYGDYIARLAILVAALILLVTFTRRRKA